MKDKDSTLWIREQVQLAKRVIRGEIYNEPMEDDLHVDLSSLILCATDN